MENDRYGDIKGSYYLFDDWVTADIYDKKGEHMQNILVNYYGHEGVLEAYDGKSKYLVLDPMDYPRILITDDPKKRPKDLRFVETLTLNRSALSGSNSDYHITLYLDEGRQLLLDYSVTIATVTERPPGKIIEKKKFNKRFVPALIIGDKIQSFSNKKKEVKKAFQEIGDITKWCKSNKMKVTSYEAMVAFLGAKP